MAKVPRTEEPGCTPMEELARAGLDPSVVLDILGRGISDEVMLLTPEFEIAWANQASLDASGRTHADVVGQPCYRVTHGLDAPCTGEDHPCPLRLEEGNGPPRVVTHRHQDADGEPRHVEITAYPLRTPTGELSHFVHLSRDITERVRAEQRVVKLNRILRTLSECNQMIVREPTVQRVLDEACRLIVLHGGYRMACLGLLRADGEGLALAAHHGDEQGFLERVRFDLCDHPDSLDPVVRAVREAKPVVVDDFEALADEVPWVPLALAVQHRSVASLPVCARGDVLGVLNVWSDQHGVFEHEERALLEELAGDIGFAIGNLRDAERLRALNRDLGRSEARWRALFNATHDGIVVQTVGADGRAGRLFEVNDVMSEATGYTRDELLELEVSDLIENDPDDDRHLRAERLAKGELVVFEARARRRGGGTFPVEISTRRVDIAGRPAQLSIVRDISEARDLRAQLVQAQKMEAVGLLAGGIAHDFNNLLAVITMYGDLMSGQLPGADPIQEDLAQVQAAVQRASDLTRQLLAFSRKQRLEPCLLDLRELAAGMQRMLRRVLGTDLELVVLLEDHALPVRADPGQLEQVVLNLAINARDAMPDGGSLTLEVCRWDPGRWAPSSDVVIPAGDYAGLRVSDSGHGMDQAVLARVFEPFFTTKARDRGTGLGLSTVYGIIKQSGGHIWARSSPGQGSAFHILLPIVDRGVEMQEGRPAVGASTRGSETVLLVDDAGTLRRAVRRVLQKRGYRVLDAASGPEALTILRQHPGEVHLLLTDIVMPVMSGRELAAEVLARSAQTRVLFMSGYDEGKQVGDTPVAPRAALLLKPFLPEVLLEAVRAALDGPPCGGVVQPGAGDRSGPESTS